MEPFFNLRIRDSRLAGIDGRLKILGALGLLIMILSSGGVAFPLIVTGGFIFLCLRLKVPLKVLGLRFAEPLFIATVILLIKLFGDGKEVLFSTNLLGFTIVGHSDGLRNGLTIACRMLGAVSVVVLLGFCTSFTELVAGFSWLRLPKAFIEVMVYAYRYIFVLAEEAAVIYEAQKNRFGYSSLWRGCNSFGILAASLTLKAFDHSQTITTSMIQRGYSGDVPMLKLKPFTLLEITAAVLFLMTTGTLCLLVSGS